MASLSSFRSNVKAITQGTWVKPLDDSDLEICTKGPTDAFVDARNSRLRKAASAFRGDQSRIPNATYRRIIADVMIEHCLLDVRGLEDTDGKAVPFATFVDLLHDEAFIDLWNASVAAIAQVGQEREADREEAEKNSAKP